MGLLSSLRHIPPQTATKDGLSGPAAGPPRHFPSQASMSGGPLPELWHLPLNHSSSFAYHRPLSLPFSGYHNSFARNSSNYLGFNSGAILICLNVTSIFLPWHLLTGHKVGFYLGSPASHFALNCQHPTFLIFWISFFLYSFPSLLICELHYLLLHVTMPTAFPKECAFSSSNVLGRTQARQSDRYVFWCQILHICLVCLSYKMRILIPTSQICWHMRWQRRTTKTCSKSSGVQIQVGKGDGPTNNSHTHTYMHKLLREHGEGCCSA